MPRSSADPPTARELREVRAFSHATKPQSSRNSRGARWEAEAWLTTISATHSNDWSTTGPSTTGSGRGSRSRVRPLIDDDEDDDGERLVDVLAYLGGALVLAAVGVIAAMAWDSLGPGAKSLLCAGGALVLLVRCGSAVGRRRTRTTRIPAMLAALASGAFGLAASVAASWIRDDTIDNDNMRVVGRRRRRR